ncbi:MAG TPA: thiamine phosphate synthase [Rhodanobacteraceae bacterium]
MTLPRLYPVFDSVDWLGRLVPLGIGMVQLRVKDQSLATVRGQIRAAKALCARHGCLLVVNDYWRLAIEEGCAWVHLGQEDLDGADITAIRAAGLKLGVSTHDDAELARAVALAPDYIALGPVWPTRLKKMRWHQQGLERVREWKTRIGDTPLVAIGGLNVERAPQAFAAGADVVAMVTDITWHADPEARVREWLAVTA